MSQPEPGSAAETYEKYFVPAMFVPWADILLRHASPQPGERVLDVACGTGIVARLAAPLVGSKGQAVAVDVNPAMLAVARAHPAPSDATIHWQEGNAVALPFPDGAFDMVLCQHGLQFIPDRASAVREMRRVLAPGGRALVIVLQALARHPVFETLVESASRHLSLPISAVLPRSLSEMFLYPSSWPKDAAGPVESSFVPFHEVPGKRLRGFPRAPTGPTGFYV